MDTETKPLNTNNRDYNALHKHLREERDRKLAPIQAMIDKNLPYGGTFKQSRDFIWTRYFEALSRLNEVFTKYRSDEL